MVADEISLKIIDSLSPASVKKTLLPMLRKGVSFDLPKAKSEVKAYLSDLLVLTDSEREYLYRFNCGEYRPELLFDDEAILNRIRNHPMALWKASGIKNHPEHGTQQ